MGFVFLVILVITSQTTNYPPISARRNFTIPTTPYSEFGTNPPTSFNTIADDCFLFAQETELFGLFYTVECWRDKMAQIYNYEYSKHSFFTEPVVFDDIKEHGGNMNQWNLAYSKLSQLHPGQELTGNQIIEINMPNTDYTPYRIITVLSPDDICYIDQLEIFCLPYEQMLSELELEGQLRVPITGYAPIHTTVGPPLIGDSIIGAFIRPQTPRPQEYAITDLYHIGYAERANQYTLPVSEDEIVARCRKFADLFEKAECLRNNVETFYRYVDDKTREVPLGFNDLVFKGGYAIDWAALYQRLGYQITQFSMEYESAWQESRQAQNIFFHPFTVIANEQGYCIMEHLEVFCVYLEVRE